MNLMKFFFPLFTLFILTSSCDKNRIYEKNIDIANYEWTYENAIKFEAEIIDANPKNLFINIRHTHFFEARNIILKLEIESANKEKLEQTINIPLSEPNGMWYGECFGDICDIQFPLKDYTSYSFPNMGKYTFTISQDMRIDPLPNVMSVGLRIENSN